MTKFRITLCVLATLCFASLSQAQIWKYLIPPTVWSPTLPSNPAIPVQTSTTTGGTMLAARATTTTVAAPTGNGSQPRDMKLLVIGVDGNEPSFQAIVSFLDYIGIPYQTVLSLNQPLPELVSGSKGLFQGIILSTGNLAVCNPTCHSALPQASWDALDAYTATYKVRMAAFYAWPELRYGLTYNNVSVSTSLTAPSTVNFTSAAATVFPYLNTATPVKVGGAYLYGAIATPAAGETVTPLMTYNGAPVAVLATKADGREYLAMTFDHSPYLMHSLTLNYGVFNWVTKGVFIGARKVYFSAQMDDYFLPNSLFQKGVSACMPQGFMVDPTYDSGTACREVRMSGGDLDQLAHWQDGWNNQTQFRGVKLGLVFNGWGSSVGGGDYGLFDGLSFESLIWRSKFYWVNHTFDHEDLDCYNPKPNSGICTPATQSQSATEISKNVTVARLLGLPHDATSLVTPGISGLANPAFIAAAKAAGIRYLMGDTSRAGLVPAKPNTGVVSSYDAGMLFIPRRPVNVFYNTSSGQTNAAGSLPDEYNYFYGPNGIFKITTATGTAPFFSTIQTYADIVNRESDNLLTYMLRYEIYPTMWHQANYVRYQGSSTLFTDVVNATFNKFAKISNLPVISMQQSEIGAYMWDRMALNKAAVTATLTPGVSIAITSSAAVKVPITGVCQGTCETYGTQKLSKVSVAAGTTTVAAY
jgi:hypothetical protein